MATILVAGSGASALAFADAEAHVRVARTGRFAGIGSPIGSTTSRWRRFASATAEVDRCRSGRAVVSSPKARSSRQTGSRPSRSIGVFRSAPTTSIVAQAEPLGPTMRTDDVARSQTSCHSFCSVRTGGHSFVPAKVRTAVARSGGPGRPSGRQRFTMDGRERDGSLAISRGDGVHCDYLSIVHVVERCSAC
jgi:hypothetical protein